VLKTLCNQLIEKKHELDSQTERGNIYGDSYLCKPVIHI